MDRREFVSMSGVGAAAAGVGAAAALISDGALAPGAHAQGAPKAKLPPVKAKLGHLLNQPTDKQLDWVARYGVEALNVQVVDSSNLFATVDQMSAMRDRVEKRNMKFEVLDTGWMDSEGVDRSAHPEILLGLSPERDRLIDAFNTNIMNASKIGIKAIKYNLSILGVIRSGQVQARGDAVYNTWNAKTGLVADPYLDRNGKPLPRLTKAGVVSADMFWERIDYWLSHVVPVANQYKVGLACHPHDPGMPPEGYQGVSEVLGSLDGMKKFVTMHESPYHGVNFCQGTMSENLEHPNDEICDAIRWFGSRKKIFNVHFRNIKGHRGDFTAETFPDDGDVDFVNALKAYREVGYDEILMPDHAPTVRPADPNSANENFAFEFGYIRGLIRAERHIV